jgi:hypothetical protein
LIYDTEHTSVTESVIFYSVTLLVPTASWAGRDVPGPLHGIPEPVQGSIPPDSPSAGPDSDSGFSWSFPYSTWFFSSLFLQSGYLMYWFLLSNKAAFPVTSASVLPVCLIMSGGFLKSLLRKAVHGFLEILKPASVEGVMDHIPSFLSRHKACLPENGKVLGDGGLAYTEKPSNRVYTQWSIGDQL